MKALKFLLHLLILVPLLWSCEKNSLEEPFDSPGQIDDDLALRLDSLAGDAMEKARQNGFEVDRADMMNGLATVVALGAKPVVAVLQINGKPRNYLVAGARFDSFGMNGEHHIDYRIFAWRGDMVNEVLLIHMFYTQGGPVHTSSFWLPMGDGIHQEASSVTATARNFNVSSTSCDIVIIPNTPIPSHLPCSKGKVEVSGSLIFTKEFDFEVNARFDLETVEVPIVVLVNE